MYPNDEGNRDLLFKQFDNVEYGKPQTSAQPRSEVPSQKPPASSELDYYLEWVFLNDKW
jgi:hypothetical protein